MRNLLAIAILVLCAACGNTTTTKNPKEINVDLVNNPRTAQEGVTETLSDLGTLSFADTLHDFGKIKEGTIVSYDFEYTNTGKRAVIISEARASCGCTVPDYSQEPIAVGEKGVLKVKFNSTHKEGENEKTVLVTNNGNPGYIRLTILASVSK
jgi:Protein of unknown function (DUF1573)